MPIWNPPDPWWKRANLISVHDGDTYYMHVDVGFRLYTDMALRLLGVNCPELTINDGPNPAGEAARDFAKNWFASHLHYPTRYWQFWVHTDKETVTYNRYVASVYCLKGHDLAADLLAAGQAVRYP